MANKLYGIKPTALEEKKKKKVCKQRHAAFVEAASDLYT